MTSAEYRAHDRNRTIAGGISVSVETCHECGRMIQLKRSIVIDLAGPFLDYVQCVKCRACTLIGLGQGVPGWTERKRGVKNPVRYVFRGLR